MSRTESCAMLMKHRSGQGPVPNCLLQFVMVGHHGHGLPACRSPRFQEERGAPHRHCRTVIAPHSHLIIATRARCSHSHTALHVVLQLLSMRIASCLHGTAQRQQG